jgi:hypothetical protein
MNGKVKTTRKPQVGEVFRIYDVPMGGLNGAQGGIPKTASLARYATKYLGAVVVSIEPIRKDGGL